MNYIKSNQLIATLLLSAVTLSGCFGGGNNDSPNNPTPTQTPSPSPTPTLTPSVLDITSLLDPATTSVLYFNKIDSNKILVIGQESATACSLYLFNDGDASAPKLASITCPNGLYNVLVKESGSLTYFLAYSASGVTLYQYDSVASSLTTAESPDGNANVFGFFPVGSQLLFATQVPMSNSAKIYSYENGLFTLLTTVQSFEAEASSDNVLSFYSSFDPTKTYTFRDGTLTTTTTPNRSNSSNIINDLVYFIGGDYRTLYYIDDSGTVQTMSTPNKSLGIFQMGSSTLIVEDGSKLYSINPDNTKSLIVDMSTVSSSNYQTCLANAPSGYVNVSLINAVEGSGSSYYLNANCYSNSSGSVSNLFKFDSTQNTVTFIEESTEMQMFYRDPNNLSADQYSGVGLLGVYQFDGTTFSSINPSTGAVTPIKTFTNSEQIFNAFALADRTFVNVYSNNYSSIYEVKNGNLSLVLDGGAQLANQVKLVQVGNDILASFLSSNVQKIVNTSTGILVYSGTAPAIGYYNSATADAVFADNNNLVVLTPGDSGISVTYLDSTQNYSSQVLSGFHDSGITSNWQTTYYQGQNSTYLILTDTSGNTNISVLQ